MAWQVLHEAVVEKTDLHKIFSKCSGLNVIVVGLGDTSKEVHWVWVAQIIVERSQDVSLSTEDLSL